MKERTVQFTPHPKQLMLLQSEARFLLALSGVQGGKTTIGALWLLREIYEAYKLGYKGDWLIAAPTVKVLQQSTIPKFKEMFPQDWGEWKEQKSCFELVWGGNIYVRSTEEPDYLEGMTIKAAWLDEAGKMKLAAWINIQARLGIHRGRAIFTTTPYTFNWINSDILRKACKINGVTQSGTDLDVDVEAFHWTSRDNPAFSQQEYDRAKRTMDPRIFAKRYEGKFTALEGLVYPDFTPECEVDPFAIPTNWKRFAGMDFGLTNPSAIVCVAEDPETKVFYAYKEFYKSEASLSVIADFLKEEQLMRVLADPQSAMVINELKKFHQISELQPADNDIDVGVERIGGLLRSDRLKFFRDRLPNTIEEIQIYHYPQADTDKPAKDKPVAKKNHAMDALRYAFSRQIEKSLYNNRPANRMKRERTLPEVDPYTGYPL
jgi:PBSX family phage terminase large subunit